MISFEEAYSSVLQQTRDYGTETVDLKEAKGRVLAEEILADRDFPPFDRATKDGIAINFDAVERGRNAFEISGIHPAGMAAPVLENKDRCLEIMTGAIMPYDADTVVMYEHLEIAHDVATLVQKPQRGQNIHRRASDQAKGVQLLPVNSTITAAEIGVLASVGKSRVAVKKLPRVAVISTGNELVEVGEFPEPHQIRKSNIYSLHAALKENGISPLLLHVTDDKDMIRQKLSFAIQEMDVLLLSGGVSRGKFDFLPQILTELGVQNIFHRVQQRPGKPFWFGTHTQSRTMIFSFPGNPVSTFVNFHAYFRPWLSKSLGLPITEISVILGEDINPNEDLTLFKNVKLKITKGTLMASLVHSGGSGDLTNLVKTDGFIRLAPATVSYKMGDSAPFIATRKLF